MIKNPNYAQRSVTWWEHMGFYLMLALDTMGQIFMGPRDARPGVTISSRAGVAKAKRLDNQKRGILKDNHRWGCVVCDTLLAWWPFGPEHGREHCKLAIESDIKRAKAVIEYLEDGVVQAWLAQP